MFLVADVSGIESQPCDTCLDGSERKFVLEVNICNEWHRRAGYHLGDRLSGRNVVTGHPNNVGPSSG